MAFSTPTHYEEGRRVEFLKTGLKMAGLLFLPDNFDENGQYPAIVVTHPGGGVKEQVSYDKPEYVGQAVQKLVEFFRKTL